MSNGIGKVTLKPDWSKDKHTCCFFCGDARSVKYQVDLNNANGERVLTVDACNRCVLLANRKDGADNE